MEGRHQMLKTVQMLQVLHIAMEVSQSQEGTMAMVICSVILDRTHGIWKAEHCLPWAGLETMLGWFLTQHGCTEFNNSRQLWIPQVNILLEFGTWIWWFKFMRYAKFFYCMLQLQWLRGIPFPLFFLRRGFMGFYLWWERCSLSQDHLYMFYLLENMEFGHGILGLSHWLWISLEWALLHMLQGQGIIGNINNFIYQPPKRTK